MSSTRTNHRRLSGFTLVEVLIALTMTLIVLGAMMVAFKYASGEMAKGRAAIEMSNQLRAAQELLRSDLEGVTLDVRPWMQTASPEGYFELIDGAGRDSTPQAPGSAIPSPDSYLGDIDDVLCMTVRSTGEPFRGRYPVETSPGVYTTTIVESSIAEIIWITVHNDRDGDEIVDFDESVDLIRRVLLIRPDLASFTETPATVADIVKQSDISYRIFDDGSGTLDLIPNSLTDLGKRENRFARIPSALFPFPIDLSGVGIFHFQNYRTQSANGGVLELNGEDILLTNIAAFDLRVFSPDTTVDEISPMLVEPGDPGYAATGDALGAFVDLGDGDGKYSGDPAPKSGFLAGEYIYCTWSPHYEYGNIGLDGIDNDGINGVDDVEERVTSPPYQQALRGLKVTFRLVEKTTKQVRQSSVIHSFVPE